MPADLAAENARLRRKVAQYEVDLQSVLKRYFRMKEERTRLRGHVRTMARDLWRATAKLERRKARRE